MEKVVTLISFNDEKLVGDPFTNLVAQHTEILIGTRKRGDELFVAWGIYAGKNEDDPDPMKRNFGEKRFKDSEEFLDHALAAGHRMKDNRQGYVEVGILRLKMGKGSA